MEFEPRDRAVYLPESDVLVCADLHVGADAASNAAFPVGERSDLVDRFRALLEHYRPTETVVAGDLLHSFDRLPTGVTETVRELERAAADVGAGIVVTPGNHDTLLDALWNGRLEAEYRLDGTDVVVTHGHVPPEGDATGYVVGHDHPMLEVEGSRHPCYLYGPQQYGDAAVLMLPPFSRLPAGTPVNGMDASDFQSPFVEDAIRLRPVVRDETADETHEFPPLGEFRELL